jgi:hypothetical protein
LILNAEQFIGWKLDEARAALARDESTRALALRLIETAAPLRKNQSVEEQGAKLGAWRVLRAQVVESEIEFTVAREQLVD